MLIALPQLSRAAADDCLSEPSGDKSDGQHWYYRFDRGSNRRCWYLKDTTSGAKDNARDSARDPAPRQTNQPSAWDFAQPAAPKLTPRRSNGPAPRASTEALADDAGAAAKPQSGAMPSLVRTQPASSFDDSLQRSAAAPSWQPLDSVDMDASASAPAAVAPALPDEAAAASDPAASTSPADASIATPAKPVKPVAPIQKLLMVVVGALSLSGLLASALYRLSKVGSRRRRNRNWQRAIARVRRNRDKPRAKSKVVHADIRPHRAAKRPVMAPAVIRTTPPPPTPAVVLEPKPIVATRTAPPASAMAEKPQPVIAVAPAAVDPAAELVDLLASHTAKIAPPQAAETLPRAAEPLPSATAPVPSEVNAAAAELVDLLGSHAARRAAQQPVAEAVTPPSRPPLEAAPPRLPLVADPAAELTNLLESRFAPPPAPPARPVAAHARPRPPAMPVNSTPPSVADPISALASLLEAKESERAARLGGTDKLGGGSRPEAALPEPQPIKAVQSPRLEPSTPGPVNAAPPANSVQPNKGTAPRRKKVAPPVRIDGAPTDGIPAAAEPTGQVAAPRKAPAVKPAAARAEPRAVDLSRTDHPKAAGPKVATPKVEAAKPGKAPRRAAGGAAPRRKNTELPPLPPALLLEPENTGPEPPLDFIPRPQALRPRMRDIRQDESLDGVQDILARLAKHG